ncbi:hypothetical protein GGD66_006953 [Bradyrhizobium sp. CIR48]|uniref:hypothetical protein n=1 Tax=Bradyrhizobium sp. CIR48 TaxID=2663840 RepID=UPI001605B832|nr:hypothetical protein [Bradyrhizobium sp. CIR48]MBB4428366.1 hypothetical protein [Bradyrhizobium sp. CIR48]
MGTAPITVHKDSSQQHASFGEAAFTGRIRYSHKYADAHELEIGPEYDLGVGDDRDPTPIRHSVFAAWCIALALLGVASAFGWRASRGELFSQAPQHQVPTVTYLPTSDFQAYRQTTAAALQQSSATLQVQQAELKRLSSQVAQLTAEVGTLKGIVAEIRAAITRPAPKKTTPKPPLASPQGSAPLALSPTQKE